MELITRPIERRLWPRGQRTTEPLPRWLVPARFTYALLRDLGHGDLSLRAMSLVYTTMLAIVPFSIESRPSSGPTVRSSITVSSTGNLPERS